jgi:hypothetical protein
MSITASSNIENKKNTSSGTVDKNLQTKTTKFIIKPHDTWSLKTSNSKNFAPENISYDGCFHISNYTTSSSGEDLKNLNSFKLGVPFTTQTNSEDNTLDIVTFNINFNVDISICRNKCKMELSGLSVIALIFIKPFLDIASEARHLVADIGSENKLHAEFTTQITFKNISLISVFIKEICIRNNEFLDGMSTDVNRFKVISFGKFVINDHKNTSSSSCFPIESTLEAGEEFLILANLKFFSNEIVSESQRSTEEILKSTILPDLVVKFQRDTYDDNNHDKIVFDKDFKIELPSINYADIVDICDVKNKNVSYNFILNSPQDFATSLDNSIVNFNYTVHMFIPYACPILDSILDKCKSSSQYVMVELTSSKSWIPFGKTKTFLKSISATTYLSIQESEGEVKEGQKTMIESSSSIEESGIQFIKYEFRLSCTYLSLSSGEKEHPRFIVNYYPYYHSV